LQYFFVIKKGLKIETAFQVCLSLSDSKVKNKKMQALKDANTELKPIKFLIVTEDEKGVAEIVDTIVELILLWKWLLRD